MTGIHPSSPASIFSLTDHELYVITAQDGERSNGQIATWIVPATLVADHPRIVAVISPLNYTHDLIASSRRFAVNMLAEEQFDLVPRFGLFSGRDRNKFDGIDIVSTKGGLPVLMNTCGWVECQIIGEMNGGDRMIYLADVVDHFVDPARRPLRKHEAFASISPEIRRLLEEKQRLDGIRDAALISLIEFER
jgi:flavin reductase (DIM6/NTAB) family NADH-FMN oxidoreductase RutF